MAFLSRHCCSLSQQQCAEAEAAANQSSRSCTTHVELGCGKAPSTATSSACACALLATGRKSSNTRHVNVHTMHVHVACWYLPPLIFACRRRRNFARQHNDSCKMTYTRMALWKRGLGSLIAATGLQELASSQHGGWLAEDGRGANCRLQPRQALLRAQRARRCDAPLSV